jgi:hypothetical protein
MTTEESFVKNIQNDYAKLAKSPDPQMAISQLKEGIYPFNRFCSQPKYPCKVTMV